MKLKLRYTTRQPQVLERTRELELTESELQILLDRIGAAEFDVNPSARELLDYLDGRGEFALYVDFAARHEDVRYLISRLSKDAHYSQPESPVIAHQIVEEGDEEGFRAISARPIA